MREQMQIYLRNEIRMDEEMEVIVQAFPVEVMEKNGQCYLLYQNEEDEKVVIKADELEMVMTRFSTPKTIMRFLANKEAILALPTPMGTQHFVTDTHLYQRDLFGQKILLHYDLKPLEGEGVFASYQMEIQWREE